MNDMIRWIPSINELLQLKAIQNLRDLDGVSDTILKKHLRLVVGNVREQILKKDAEFSSKEQLMRVITEDVMYKVNRYVSNQVEPVINATGTVLHTNLGRARLSDKAVKHVEKISRHYSTLEFDVDSGGRGSRHDLVEEYIKDLTGAEAAIVVNNNAASVYMVLSAFAKSHEVIVSRGELVEIGGSFRVSSIMEESGAILKEVGTTNKTHEFDYEQAISDQTKMLMKVHTSNFQIVGFTKQVKREKLVELAHKHDVMTYEDLGSGMVYDFDNIGQEPLVKDVISSGIDLVSFSGDKLFGGPQVGIIIGKKKYINQLKKHQLARVLRADKMTYAALEITLKQWLLDDPELPVLRDIQLSKEELKVTVNEFIKRYHEYSNTVLNVNEKELVSKVGGGTLPGVALESYGIELSSSKFSAEEIKRRLRRMTPRIICRIENNSALLDFRTVTTEESEIILEKLVSFSK